MKNKNPYIVYIDESNISAQIGYTCYASIFILFSNREKVANKVSHIESELKIAYTHWVDMPWKLRVSFSEKIQKLDFICIIKLYRNPVSQEKILDSFLNQIINSERKINRIIIDGKKGKRYKEKLKSRLKNSSDISYNLRFVDVKGNSLVRLADFMAGLVRSYKEDKNKYNEFMFDILKHKIYL